MQTTNRTIQYFDVVIQTNTCIHKANIGSLPITSFYPSTFDLLGTIIGGLSELVNEPTGQSNYQRTQCTERIQCEGVRKPEGPRIATNPLLVLC